MSHQPSLLETPATRDIVTQEQNEAITFPRENVFAVRNVISS